MLIVILCDIMTGVAAADDDGFFARAVLLRFGELGRMY